MRKRYALISAAMRCEKQRGTDMNELKVKAYELRQVVLDMIMKSGGGHIGGDFSVMDILVA